jgi:hypothetical protein
MGIGGPSAQKLRRLRRDCHGDDDDERPGRMADPRFFVPAYVGPKGWLGTDVDRRDTDWTEISELLDASFRWVAPARLLRELDARGDVPLHK